MTSEENDPIQQIGSILDGAEEARVIPLDSRRNQRAKSSSTSGTKAEEFSSEPSQSGGLPESAAIHGRGGGGTDDPAAREIDRRGAKFPLTDLGNAERFVARFGSSFKWCGKIGWFAWDGKRWGRELAEGLVESAAQDTVRAIQAEAQAMKGTDDDFLIETKKDGTPVMRSDKVRDHGRRSEGNSHIRCIPELAKAHLEISPDVLDADPLKINVLNGTIIITRGGADDVDPISFRPHDRGDLITKVAAVAYDPSAICPEYDAFLGYVQPTEAMRRFLHAWGGLSLTGDATEQVMTFQYGKGKNGKSTLLDAWGRVAGDYGDSVPIETFLDLGRARSAGQASPDLADMPGVRFMRTSEPERNSKLAEALIKQLTGGEPIKARHLFSKNYFRFRPQFKLTMSGNYKPQIVGTDEGIKRRLVLVPWRVTVPEAKRDKNLSDKLAAETSGILNRLLDGLRDWIENGLKRPEEVVQATESYFTDSDPLGRFLDACVAPEKGSRVQASELHRLFCAWAKANGEREWTPTGFGRAMGERGYEKMQSNVNWYLNVKTVRTVNEFIDLDGRPLQQAKDDWP